MTYRRVHNQDQPTIWPNNPVKIDRTGDCFHRTKLQRILYHPRGCHYLRLRYRCRCHQTLLQDLQNLAMKWYDAPMSRKEVLKREHEKWETGTSGRVGAGHVVRAKCAFCGYSDVSGVVGRYFLRVGVRTRGRRWQAQSSMPSGEMM